MTRGLVLCAALLLSAPALAFEPPRVTLSIGAFDFDGVGAEKPAYSARSDAPAQIELEVVPGEAFGLVLGPVLAEPYLRVGFTTDQARYVATGLALDLSLGKSWRFVPHAGLGLYHPGATGKVLSPEDPSCLRVVDAGADLYYRLPGGSRIGIGFQHFSHGEVLCKDTRNPASNSLMLRVSIPLK